MKRYLLAALLLLVPAIALAGWNLRQTGEGGAVWQDSVGNSFGIGGPLVIEITDLSTQSTHFAVVHRPGTIVRAYMTNSAAFSAQSDDATVTLWVNDALQTDQFTQVSNPAGATLVLPTTASAATTISNTFTNANTVDVGDVIAVTTDGGSTGTARGTITIVIE